MPFIYKVFSRYSGVCKIPRMLLRIATPSSVTFGSLSGANAPDGFVFREAPKVFEVGNYPDKNFEFTKDDAARAVAAFRPVQIDLEHQSTVLDGKLGKLVQVSLNPDGVTLSGVVEIPNWLDENLKGQPIPVSLEFDRETKQIVKMALTVDPRVRDAAIAAFNRGASSPKKESVTMSKLKELRDGIAALFSKHLAGEGDDAATTDPADASGASAASGAPAAPNPLPSPENPVTPPPPIVAPPASPAISAELSNRLAKAEATNAQFAAQIAKLEAEQRNKDAEHFADEVIRQGKAFPTERNFIVAQFCAAHDDDKANPKTVQFGAKPEEKGTRLDALKASFAARPENPLLREQIAATGQLIFSGKSSAPVSGEEKTAGMSAERKAKLMGATNLGRAVMAEKGDKAKC